MNLIKIVFQLRVEVLNIQHHVAHLLRCEIHRLEAVITRDKLLVLMDLISLRRPHARGYSDALSSLIAQHTLRPHSEVGLDPAL